MLRTLAVFGILIGSAAAQDRWVYMRSDRLELLTNAGAKAGRAELVFLEQFRYSLGRILGKTDLVISPPPLVLLFKTDAEAASFGAENPIQIENEHTLIVLSPALDPVEFNRRFAKLLIDSNTDRMPAEFEQGLISLFSTLEVSGIRVTLGKPVPDAQRDKAWARMHFLTVDPENYVKLPVLFFNLQKGAEEDPAFRNSLGRSKAQIEAEVDRYLAAGNFSTASPPSLPMSADRDFPEKPLSPADMQQKFAAIVQERELQAEYNAQMAKAHDDINDTRSLERAIEIAPKKAEPRFLLAQQEWDPKKRAELIKVAIALDRRNASYWNALAESYVAAHDYTEAAKAWTAAEQAAATPAERARMRQARQNLDNKRLDFEAADKKRIADEEARSLQKLKDAEIAKLRALEASVSGSKPTLGETVVPWASLPTPDAKASGILQQVDCLGKQARLIIKADDGKIVRLVVRDPSQITFVGAAEVSLGCGRVKPRKIKVEYFRNADAKLATIGDVATIEFP